MISIIPYIHISDKFVLLSNTIVKLHHRVYVYFINLNNLR